jgi:HEAT repeat protein
MLAVKHLTCGYGWLEAHPVRAAAPIALVLWLLPLAGWPNPAARAQAEARAEVQRLLSGQASPHHVLVRLQYLGQTDYPAQLLANAWPSLVEPELRRRVSTVLAGLPVKKLTPLFVELTAAPDSTLRMNGAIGLGLVRSETLAPLVPLLQDPSAGVRREAGRALCASGAKRMGKVVLEAARTEGEPEVRTALLEAVGRCGDRKTAAPLARFLESSSEGTRFAAARGLCLLGAQQGFDFARALLRSEDRYVRRQGVALFDGLPSRAAKVHLEPMLQDADLAVAAFAARVLYQGGDGSKLEWLVVKSYQSNPEQRLSIEAELDKLMLTDDQRKTLLKKAGIL